MIEKVTAERIKKGIREARRKAEGKKEEGIAVRKVYMAGKEEEEEYEVVRRSIRQTRVRLEREEEERRHPQDALRWVADGVGGQVVDQCDVSAAELREPGVDVVQVLVVARHPYTARRRLQFLVRQRVDEVHRFGWFIRRPTEVPPRPRAHQVRRLPVDEPQQVQRDVVDVDGRRRRPEAHVEVLEAEAEKGDNVGPVVDNVLCHRGVLEVGDGRVPAVRREAVKGRRG